MHQRNNHYALSKILYKIQNENIKTLYCTRDTLVDKIDPFSNFIRINKRHCMYSSTSNKLVHQKFGWNRHFQAQVSTAFCLCHHILCMILITQRNVKWKKNENWNWKKGRSRCWRFVMEWTLSSSTYCALCSSVWAVLLYLFCLTRTLEKRIYLFTFQTHNIYNLQLQFCKQFCAYLYRNIITTLMI